MKQFFLSAALLIGASLSFTACNNGAYDTDPASNNSGAGNPFNTGGGSGGSGGGTGGGGSVALGTITVKLNGSTKTFTNGVADLFAGDLEIRGTNVLSQNSVETFKITVEDYTTPKIYDDPFGTKVELEHAKVNGTGFDFIYGGLLATNRGTVEVTSDANSQFKGTFSGSIFYDGPNSANVNDSVVVTEGSFNVQKI